jgi:hypothetical protein
MSKPCLEYVVISNQCARSVFAVGCAIPVIFVRDFAAIIALIWFLLFFGGAIVPAATGSPRVRALMSLANFTTRVFGCLLRFFIPLARLMARTSLPLQIL